MINQRACLCRHTFAVMVCAAGRALQMRRLTQRHCRREHILAETAEQKRGLAIKRTTGNGPSEMAPEATREFRRQQHRRVTRVELACTQSRGGTMARGPAELRRSHQPIGRASWRERVCKYV